MQKKLALVAVAASLALSLPAFAAPQIASHAASIPQNAQLIELNHVVFSGVSFDLPTFVTGDNVRCVSYLARVGKDANGEVSGTVSQVCNAGSV